MFQIEHTATIIRAVYSSEMSVTQSTSTRHHSKAASTLVNATLQDQVHVLKCILEIICHTYNLLQMVKVMSFRWWEKWKMIAWMGIESRQDCQWEPEPRSGYMWSHDEHSKEYRKQIWEYTFQWMTIHCCHCNWSCPFMVPLVNEAIQVTAMKNSKTNKTSKKMIRYIYIVIEISLNWQQIQCSHC